MTSTLVPHVVICYPRKKKGGSDPTLDALVTHCKGLQDAKKLTYFYDESTRSGEWEKKLKGEFAKADAAVLLVSSKFLSSDFIREVELPLLEKQYEQKRTQLFPLLVAKCGYDTAYPFLKNITFPEKTTERPLMKRPTAERDEVFVRVLEEICKIDPTPTPVPSPKPRQAGIRKKKGGRRYFHADAGFLIAAEVVNFIDQRTDADQELVVRRLWQFTKTNELTKDRPSGFCFERGLGDGILLAFPGNQARVHWGSVYQCAKDLVAFMAAEKVDLRIGLHQGPFNARHLRQRRGFEVFGPGRRVCERLAAVGDRGNIVATEDFLTAWRENRPNDAGLNDFYPHEGPIEVFSRRRREALRVRVAGDPQGNAEPPSRLQLLAVIRQKIMSELEVVDDAFCAGLKELDSFYEDPHKLSVRVSVWMPDLNDKGLTCTDLRHHRQKLDKLTGRSETRHWFEPPRGPIGGAYARNDVCVSHVLPDPDAALDEYIGRIVGTWNITEREARSFRRHARAYVGIPICFSPEKPPELVLCLDLSDPLERVTEVQIVKLCERIRKETENVLGSLWMLRIKA